MSKKILIVDDDPSALSQLKEFLERAGYTVITAVDGQGGVAKALAEKPDLVVTDYVMPIASGRNLIVTLRAQGFATPIIVFCSTIDLETITDLKQRGANDHLNKVVGFTALKSLIARTLAKSGQEETGTGVVQ